MSIEKVIDWEAKYRELFENMAQGVVYQDTRGRIVSANPAAERILGITQEQMNGITSLNPCWQAIREDGSPFPGNEHPAMIALNTGQKVNNVVMGVYNPKECRYRWININAVPQFRQGREKPYLVYTTFEDITLRKQTEEALYQAKSQLEIRVRERTKELQESEEKFKTLSEKSLVGIYIIRDSDFKYMNPAFAQIFDYTIEELTQKPFYKIVCPRDRQKIKEKIRKLMQGKIDYSHSQFRGIPKKGEPRFLEIYQARILLENRPAIIGTLIDVTQRIHFEEALQEKTSQLETLNKELEKRIEGELEKRRKQEQILVQQSKLAAMGEMVGAIAHQWRQPLTTVGVIIHKLKMAYRLNKLTAAMMDIYVKDAQEQIQFMSKTIDDFRNFFRPSKAKEFFPILKTVKEAISIVRSQLDNHSIHIRVQGDFTESCQAYGYPNEFKQVLVNIFNNARNAIRDKCKTGLMNKNSGEIVVAVIPGDQEVLVKISNNGGNIPEKIMDRIFEPYFTTRETGNSMGIGLYMSKIIVENQMGGRIYGENLEDGVIFIIELKNNRVKEKEYTGLKREPIPAAV